MKKTKRRNNVIPFPVREEFASETHVQPLQRYTVQKQKGTKEYEEVNERKKEGGQGIGVMSVFLALLAFFMMPIILGVSGFIMGYIAAARGSRAGRWAMGLSAIAVLLTLLLRPFY
jgi:hypothetical protein